MNDEKECQQCGRCCRNIGMMLFPDKLTKALLEMHLGREIDRVRINMLSKCKHLTEDNLCGIYDSVDRPEICHSHYCKDGGRQLILTGVEPIG